MAIEWLGLGAAVVSIGLRAMGHGNVADGVDSAAGPLSTLSARDRSLAEQIDRRLQGEIDTYLGGRRVDAEMTAAAHAATVVVAGLAQCDPQALAVAWGRPSELPAYVRAHGGHTQRQLIAAHALDLYDYVLAISTVNSLASPPEKPRPPHSRSFINSTLPTPSSRQSPSDTRRGADNVVRAADSVKELLERNLRKYELTLPRMTDLAATQLGVHRAMRPVSEFNEQRSPADSPPYIFRDHDQQLRTAMREAIGRGGGVVVIRGRSCTGKSRSAWEAARSLLDQWLVADLRDPTVVNAVAAGQLPDEDCLIWLGRTSISSTTPPM